MSKKNVWVTGNRAEGYVVKSEGASRAARHTETQAEAIQVARGIAENRGAELIVQNTHGQIRQKDSFGNDPNPPKG